MTRVCGPSRVAPKIRSHSPRRASSPARLPSPEDKAPRTRRTSAAGCDQRVERGSHLRLAATERGQTVTREEQLQLAQIMAAQGQVIREIEGAVFESDRVGFAQEFLAPQSDSSKGAFLATSSRSAVTRSSRSRKSRWVSSVAPRPASSAVHTISRSSISATFPALSMCYVAENYDKDATSSAPRRIALPRIGDGRSLRAGNRGNRRACVTNASSRYYDNGASSPRRSPAPLRIRPPRPRSAKPIAEIPKDQPDQ